MTLTDAMQSGMQEPGRLDHASALQCMKLNRVHLCPASKIYVQLPATWAVIFEFSHLKLSVAVHKIMIHIDIFLIILGSQTN